MLKEIYVEWWREDEQHPIEVPVRCEYRDGALRLSWPEWLDDRVALALKAAAEAEFFASEDEENFS